MENMLEHIVVTNMTELKHFFKTNPEFTMLENIPEHNNSLYDFSGLRFRITDSNTKGFWYKCINSTQEIFAIMGRVNVHRGYFKCLSHPRRQWNDEWKARKMEEILYMLTTCNDGRGLYQVWSLAHCWEFYGNVISSYNGFPPEDASRRSMMCFAPAEQVERIYNSFRYECIEYPKYTKYALACVSPCGDKIYVRLRSRSLRQGLTHFEVLISVPGRGFLQPVLTPFSLKNLVEPFGVLKGKGCCIRDQEVQVIAEFVKSHFPVIPRA